MLFHNRFFLKVLVFVLFIKMSALVSSPVLSSPFAAETPSYSDSLQPPDGDLLWAYDHYLHTGSLGNKRHKVLNDGFWSIIEDSPVIDPVSHIVVDRHARVIFSQSSGIKALQPDGVKGFRVFNRHLSIEDRYMSRETSFIGAMGNDLYLNQNDRLFRSNRHGHFHKIYGNDIPDNEAMKPGVGVRDPFVMNLDANIVFAVIDGQLKAIPQGYGATHFSQPLHSSEYMNHDYSHPSTSIVGHGGTLYSVSSVWLGEQSKLLISRIDIHHPEIVSQEGSPERLLWTRDYETFGEQLSCKPETAVSSDGVYVACGNNIYVLSHDGKPLFHDDIKEEPGVNKHQLKGLVVDRRGHFYIQGSKGLYFFLRSDSGLYTRQVYPYGANELAAEGMLILQKGKLLAASVRHPEVSIQHYGPGSKPRLVIRIFQRPDQEGSLVLLEEETIPLVDHVRELRHYRRDSPDAWYEWQVKGVNILGDGHVYVPVNAITRLDKTSYTSGPSMIICRKYDHGVRLDSTAPWPKLYHDRSNSNYFSVHRTGQDKFEPVMP